jgi:hypothetical protein
MIILNDWEERVVVSLLGRERDDGSIATCEGRTGACGPVIASRGIVLGEMDMGVDSARSYKCPGGIKDSGVRG